MPPRLTTIEFIERAKLKHGTRYLYDKTVYLDSHTEVLITCKIHGDFFQRPRHHLSGSGCSQCTNNGRNSSRPAPVNLKIVAGSAWGWA